MDSPKKSRQDFTPPPADAEPASSAKANAPQMPSDDFIGKTKAGVQELKIRVAARMGKAINKPAITGAVGAAFALVLALGVSGLAAHPKSSSDQSKPLMSDPARQEMAQGLVRDLPQSYDDARLARINASTSDTPQLGPAMAGDIAAFAPNINGTGNYGAGDSGIDPIAMGMRTRSPGSVGSSGMGPASYTRSYQSQMGYSANSQADEVGNARKSGLFFALREKAAVSGATISANPISDLESADRDLMTSPHKILSAQSSRSLLPGAIIPASLITAINSDTPGPVVAQVTEEIFDSATGDQLLIPQGAKLIGAYKASSQYGQKRVTIIWSRLVFPNGSQIVLNELAADSSGAAGLNGRVDDHWGAAFKAATLGTLINMGAAAAEDRNSIGVTYSGIGIINGDDPVEQAAREGVQRTASTLSNRVVDRALSLPPTIRIKAGARVQVLVSRELDL